MRLAIRHMTSYTYDTPVLSSSQIIRLSPRHDGGQSVEKWSVEAFATLDQTSPPVAVRLLPGTDGHQNGTHLLSIARRHTSSSILAMGVVQTTSSDGIVGFDDSDLPLAFWLKQTPQTEAGPPVRDLTLSAWVGHETASDGGADLEAVHRLMNEVRRRVDYVIGATSVTTTADEAVIRGAGVCQDHAHVFIAAARSLGIPARYVSGYLWPGHHEVATASHAWAEAWVNDLGWVGFDPANNVCPTEAYIRVAVGLDYFDASPVRGVRRAGPVNEEMVVTVQVDPVKADADVLTSPAS